jgi:hypothetical protein
MALFRYQLFIGYAIALLSIWFMALQKRSEYEDNNAMLLLIYFLPLWAVVAVGVYLLTILIVGVMSFNDVPNAGKELEAEIKEAKAEMKKRDIQ